MPASLNVLADEVRSHIIGAGRGYRASILGLGDEVRSHIIGAGVSLHGGVLQYVAEEVYFEILDHGATYDPEDLETIAHNAWLTALESGGSLLSGTEFDGLPCSLLHIAPDSEGRSQHQVEVCLMSDRPVPTTGEGAHQLLVSESGREALIVWEDEEGNVHYIESNGSDSWSEEQVLTIGKTLSAERALRVLSAAGPQPLARSRRLRERGSNLLERALRERSRGGPRSSTCTTGRPRSESTSTSPSALRLMNLRQRLSCGRESARRSGRRSSETARKRPWGGPPL